MHPKEVVYTHCCDILKERIREAQRGIDAAQQDSNSETKSSAGDKYETGRAMAQLEKERHARRKAMLEDMLLRLRQIGCSPSTQSATEGSMVCTNRGVYFISIGIGSIVFESQTYHCLSQDSPFGEALLDLEVGDEVDFREVSHEIVRIL